MLLVTGPSISSCNSLALDQSIACRFIACSAAGPAAESIPGPCVLGEFAGGAGLTELSEVAEEVDDAADGVAADWRTSVTGYACWGCCAPDAAFANRR